MIKLNSNVNISKSIEWAFNKMNAHLTNNRIRVDFTLELLLDEKIKSQGYKRCKRSGNIIILSSDDAGFMYGILDLATAIIHEGGIEGVGELIITPYIENRGVKFNIPLDARTPSYSDASDSAFHNIENMWDFSFWTEFLDRMAIDKYNVLSLWSLSPFPSLVSIPKYPLIALDDVKKSMRPIKADLGAIGMYDEDMAKSLVTVKKMTIDDKVSFWQSVMEYAKDRCIKIYIFTWNLFVYGTEGNPYGITCDQTNPITKDYIYEGVKALMDTYPLLAGIGITSGENMLRDDTDIPFLADSYGRGVRDYLSQHPDRDFRYIHRMHYTGYDNIISEYKDFPCPFEISFKYSKAHMYSSTKPSFINDLLNEKDEKDKIWLTIRNDDFYMYRWGDPEYAREYIKQMPIEHMTGFYMGADGYTWGRDYMDLRDQSHPLYIDKMWYMWRIWGRLSYNPDLSNDYFIKELENRFEIPANDLYNIWKKASGIIPEVNKLHWHDYDFQWYPEGSCMYDFTKDKLVFADINEFITCRSMPGENIYSISEYCQVVIEGGIIDKNTPISIANKIRDYSKEALSGVEQIRSIKINNQELIYTLDDIEALAYLGRYYGAKIRAAVSLCLYGKTGDGRYQEDAARLLQTVAIYWKSYSAKSKEMYQAQSLVRLCSHVDVQSFDKLALLDVYNAME